MSALSVSARSLVLALVAGPLLVVGASGPASADYFDTFALDTRPASLPATEVPARRLDAGSVSHSSNRDARTVSAQVTLAAEPTSEDDAVLLVGLGSLGDDGRCVLAWQRTVSTFAPATSEPDPADVARSVVRDGARLDLSWSLTTEAYQQVGGAWCGTARVLDPVDGTSLDELDGTSDGGVVGDPVYRARITDVRDRQVRPGRWSRLTVLVEARSDVRGFRLDGRGRGVEVVGRGFERAVPFGTTTEVRLRVRLNLDRPREFVLTLDTYGSAFGPVDVKRVRLVPEQGPTGSR